MDATLTIIDPFVGQMGGFSALQGVMAKCGWIDDRAIDAVAERFNLSRAEVKGIVSFYQFRIDASSGQGDSSVSGGSLLLSQRLTTELNRKQAPLDARDQPEP